MIIWSGIYNNAMYYRALGSSTYLNKVDIAADDLSFHIRVRHNESTTRDQGTELIIGQGLAYASHKYCIHGYSLGCTPHDNQRTPLLYDYNTYHVQEGYQVLYHVFDQGRYLIWRQGIYMA